MNTHLTSRLVRTPRQIGSRSVRTIRSTPLLLMLVVILISAAIVPAFSQNCRYWQGTTLLKQTLPEQIESSLLQEAITSHAVLFYAFDTADVPGFVHVFPPQGNLSSHFRHIAQIENPSYSFPGGRDYHYVEAIYDAESAEQIIASGIRPDYMFGSTNKGVGREGNRYHLLFRGHLFEGGGAADTVSLFHVNLWYVVEKGQRYYDSAGVFRIADTSLRVLYGTRRFTRAQFLPKDRLNPDFTIYQEATALINLSRNGSGNSSHPIASLHDIDLEIIYLGGEKVALHSIEIRDSVYHLLVGETSESSAYRASIAREIGALLHHHDPATRYATFDRLFTDDSTGVGSAGYRYVKKVIATPFRTTSDEQRQR